MTNELLVHVGSQIKMFRKIKKMTIEDLSVLINKSKSTVSKYESGEIAIDIITLHNIAKALNTNIINFIDYEESDDSVGKENNFYIWEADHLYMYNRNKDEFFQSYIKLRKDEKNNKTIATLYYKLEDLNDLTSSTCIYQGYMNRYENVLNFNLKNSLFDSESVLINFFIPMKKVTTLSGLMAGLEDISLKPACVKVVLSKTPLSESEQDELLKLSNDVIKRLKEEYSFRVDV